MVGIERIDIISDHLGYTGGAEYFWRSKRHRLAANEIYRTTFELMEGREVTECSRGEFFAGYDHALGIDVLLRFTNGMIGTLQEKCLKYLDDTTVTVEYMQDPKNSEEGDWFNIKTQFYFVGYDSLHIQCPIRSSTIEQEIKTGICQNCGYPFSFQSWILLNWPSVVLESARGSIQWGERPNKHNNARASFKYADFSEFPRQCVIAQQGMKDRKLRTVEELHHRRRERSRNAN